MDMISSDNPAFSPRRRVPAHPTHLPRVWRRDGSSGSAKDQLLPLPVGHQFGPQALAAAQLEASERKLWSSVAALEEQAAVLHYVQRHAPHEQKSSSSNHDQNPAVSARYADEVASRAAGLCDQVRVWSSNPPELDAACRCH